MMTDVSTDRPAEPLCAKCGHPRKEHSYNGVCYGLCGEFVDRPSEPTTEDIIRVLRRSCTDYNQSQMPDDAEPIHSRCVFLRAAANRLEALSRQPSRDAMIEGALKDAIECAHEHSFAYTETSGWKRKYRRAVAVLDALKFYASVHPATQPQKTV